MYVERESYKMNDKIQVSVGTERCSGGVTSAKSGRRTQQYIYIYIHINL